MQQDVLRRVLDVVEAVRQVDRHRLGHDDRRVLVHAPLHALLDGVEHAAHGLVGILEADGELLHRGIVARRVDDGRGPPDEFGERDQLGSVGITGAYPLLKIRSRSGFRPGCASARSFYFGP